MSKEWEVTLPITGLAYVTVEADTEEEAIEKAMEEVSLRHIDTWEAVYRINQGNVCYAMQPWEAVAECVSEDTSQ